MQFDEVVFRASLDVAVYQKMHRETVVAPTTYAEFHAVTHPMFYRRVMCEGVAAAEALLHSVALWMLEQGGGYDPPANAAHIATQFRDEFLRSNLPALDAALARYSEVFEAFHWHAQNRPSQIRAEAEQMASGATGVVMQGVLGDGLGTWLTQFAAGAVAGEQLAKERDALVNIFIQQRNVALVAMVDFSNATEARAAELAVGLARKMGR